jgi:hypothetical protein
MKLFKARNEIRVWYRHRNHRVIWYAYNPDTNATLSFKTEEALKFWLDNYDRGDRLNFVRLWNAAGQNSHPLHFYTGTLVPPQRAGYDEEAPK